MTEPLCLFHLSDVHFGLEDRTALAWAKAEIAARRPAAVAITGDLTMRARHREFRAACEWIQGLEAPVTVEIGNHDMPYFNLVERFFDPYRRFRAIEDLVEREIDLAGLAIVPLKTAVRAQPRLNWSKGYVSRPALAGCLAALDALPAGTRSLVAVHHPLVEVGTCGTALTRHGENALCELAKRKVLAVLSGHVHDPFDLIHDTPPSFNELTWDGRELGVKVRNLEQVSTLDMLIDDVPENALPPRHEGEPVAPVGMVPAVDPPVH